MAFCTIVEWDTDVSAELSRLHEQGAPQQGSLMRVVGATETGTYAVEVWDSAEDAQRFAEASAAALAQAALPPPTRVAAFEATTSFIRPELRVL